MMGLSLLDDYERSLLTSLIDQVWGQTLIGTLPLSLDFLSVFLENLIQDCCCRVVLEETFIVELVIAIAANAWH